MKRQTMGISMAGGSSVFDADGSLSVHPLVCALGYRTKSVFRQTITQKALWHQVQSAFCHKYHQSIWQFDGYSKKAGAL